MRAWVVLALFMILAVSGCDDGATIRRNLAQCELSTRARYFGGAGGYNTDFLLTCMQARGFVIDGNLTTSGIRCGGLAGTASLEDECYRPDTFMGKWSAAFEEQ